MLSITNYAYVMNLMKVKLLSYFEVIIYDYVVEVKLPVYCKVPIFHQGEVRKDLPKEE